MALYTREDLKDMGCSTPGCKEDHSVLHISPICHRDAASDCYYNKADGVLYVECAECGKPVAAFQIAHRVVH